MTSSDVAGGQKGPGRCRSLAPRLAAGFLVLGVSAGLGGDLRAAESYTIRVQTSQPGARINPAMWGVFFEDINFAADGGLYPERVKNRSFEFPDALMGWKKAVAEGGSFAVRTDNAPGPKNTHYLRIESTGGSFGVMNDGFRGVGVEEGKAYTVSLLARTVGRGPASLTAELRDSRGQVYGSARIDDLGPSWARHAVTLTPSRTLPAGRFALLVDGKGAVDVDVVSLFPVETYKNRPGGLRKDLGEMLEALHPGFLRFPGGCIVEGRY